MRFRKTTGKKPATPAPAPRHAFGFSALFIAALLFAIGFPHFRPLTEWALPTFLIYTVNTMRMLNRALFLMAFVTIVAPFISVPVLLILYGIDNWIMRRLLGGITGWRLVLYPFLWAALKYYFFFAVYTSMFGFIIVAYYFGLRDESPVLLLGFSAILVAAALNPHWRDLLAEPGWGPLRRLWRMPAAVLVVAAVAAFCGVSRPLALRVACIPVFIYCLGFALQRIFGARVVERKPFHFNANVLVAFMFGVSAVSVGRYYLLSPGVASKDFLHRIPGPKSVYDVRPVDNATIYFSTLEKKALGRVDPRTGQIIWSPSFRRLRHMERILCLPRQHGIAVFGHAGFFTFDARTLAVRRQLDEMQFVDTAISPDGSLLYAVREFSSSLFIFSPEHGLLRTVDAGWPLLWPYAVRLVSPDTFFIDNWFFSPLFVRVDLSDGGVRVRRRLLGYFQMGMATDVRRRVIYVARPLFRRIDVVDMDSLRVVREIPTPIAVREVELDAKRDLLFAPAFFTGRLQVIDLRRNRLYLLPSVGADVRTIRLGPDGDTLFFGTSRGIFTLDWKMRGGELLRCARAEGRVRTLR
jgi:hypothetical protein